MYGFQEYQKLNDMYDFILGLIEIYLHEPK